MQENTFPAGPSYLFCEVEHDGELGVVKLVVSRESVLQRVALLCMFFVSVQAKPVLICPCNEHVLMVYAIFCKKNDVHCKKTASW